MQFPQQSARTGLLIAIAVSVMCFASRSLVNPSWADFLTITGAGVGAVALFIFWHWRQAFGWLSTPETPEERDTRWVRFTIVVFSIAGLVAVLLFSATALGQKYSWTEYFRFLGHALLLACAFFGVGTLLGFLFAIPKSLSAAQFSKNRSSETPQNETGKGTASPSGQGPVFATNSNLEEISDWLTKIIVGLGLANLKNMPGWLVRLANFFTLDCGSTNCTAATLSVIIFFSVDGFFLGYLMTRLYLVLAFTRAEKASSRLGVEETIQSIRTQAEASPAAAEGGDIEDLLSEEAPLRNLVQGVALSGKSTGAVAGIYRLADEYDALRARMKPGQERTRQMESIAAGMRGYAAAASNLLPELTSASSAGHRLAAIAMLEVSPDSRYLDWLSARFQEEQQPFIQFHAASALLVAAKQLPSPQLSAVREGIEKALQLLGDKQGTDRYKLLQKARSILDARMSQA